MTNLITQYVNSKKEFEHIREELIRLENKLLTPRAPILSPVPKGPIQSNDQLGDGFIKLEMLRDKYKRMLEDICEKQLRVEELIEDLEPLERDLMRYRYIDGLKWKDIYDKLGYAQRQTFRIHDKIIEKIEKMTYTDT